MTEQEKQELNIELATAFLGIKKIHYAEWDVDKRYPMYIPSGKPWRTHQIDAKPIPDFINDLNACFKWLVPKAITKIQDSLHINEEAVYLLLFQWWREKLVDTIEHPNSLFTVTYPALALCLAIEKLLEEETAKR